MAGEDWDLEKIRLLPYRDLQKLAVKHGLKGNAKKIDMIAGLTRILVNDAETTDESQTSDEQMELDVANTRRNDTFLIEGNSLANSTYVVDAENISTKQDELYLSLDEPVLAGNLTLDKENTVRIEEPVVTRLAVEPVSEVSGLSRPPRSQLIRSTANSVNRFAEVHKRELAKMVSIDDAQKKIDEKHKQREKSFNEKLNRLATPKNITEAVRGRFRTPSLPNQAKFKFGEVAAEKIETVQKPILLSKERPGKPASRAIVRKQSVDVKGMTMAQPIIPRSRFDQLAMPKTKQAVPVPSERRSYTPNKSPFKYVDTTRMSDSEFRAYQRQKKQEQNRLSKMVL